MAERISPRFIAPFGELGGSEMVMLRIVRGLDERFEPRALMLTPGPLADRLRSGGVPTGVERPPGKQALLRLPAVACRHARALRGERVSFIHANQAKTAVVGALLAPRLGCRSCG